MQRREGSDTRLPLFFCPFLSAPPHLLEVNGFAGTADGWASWEAQRSDMKKDSEDLLACVAVI